MVSPHAFLTHKIVESAESKDFQALLADFRSSGGILKKKFKRKFSNNLLSSFKNQNK